MFDFWKRLSYTTKFSIIAFFIILGLGLMSMGLLGALLYYPVSFLFASYPDLNDWHGDWVWPAMIGVGMVWAFGFVFAGIAWHYISRLINSKIFLRLFYVFMLWLWAALLWYLVLKSNFE